MNFCIIFVNLWTFWSGNSANSQLQAVSLSVMAAIVSLSSDPSCSELSQMCMNMCINYNNENNTGIIAQIYRE